MADVTTRNLVRRFGEFTALDDVSFDVKEGEFLTLLGPSGCGKSTMLAALAGLDRPTSGRIEIDDVPVFDDSEGIFVDAQFRDLGLMFQSYALWPHMTVIENLNFPLRLRGVRGDEARRRIRETLDLVDMEPYAERYPSELSGGQQQRIALARTLVYSPRILLLDEPLSNLDAQLRDRARVWLRDLQKRTGVTTVYVTHDQTEALGLSDRIVVMNRGRISQIGAPTDIYETPADLFVADFVGANNLLEAKFLEHDGSGNRIRLGTHTVLRTNSSISGTVPGPVMVAIRPERVEISDQGATGPNTVEGLVKGIEYQGAYNILTVELDGILVRIETRANISGGPITVRFPPDALKVFPRSDALLRTAA